jgi:hypothetical protein
MLYPRHGTSIILPGFLNLQHLQAVLQVASLGSVSRAAERVHRSQSALTVANRTIERLATSRRFLPAPGYSSIEWPASIFRIDPAYLRHL